MEEDNKELRVFKIHITDKKLNKVFIDYTFKYKLFDNLLTIMLNQYQDDFKYLSDYTVLRAVLRKVWKV